MTLSCLFVLLFVSWYLKIVICNLFGIWNLMIGISLERIILASPRGFCAGVDRAIKIVEKALEVFGAPIYVRHQIVHNSHVVSELEAKGVVFIEELTEVPDDQVVIFSAHGISPKVREEAKLRGLNTIDATCPLVTKVHLEAVSYHKKGYRIFLIGHKGHQEVVGTMGEAPMELIETLEDVEKLETSDSDQIGCLTQTTLSLDDTKVILDALKSKFPNMNIPAADDICYATQNRQNAVKDLAKHCDLVLVIGSETSSNSKRLVDTAKAYGANSYLIENAFAMDLTWLAGIKSLGVTSGASGPEELVQELLDKVQKMFPDAKVETLDTVKENMVFKMPEIAR